MECMLGSRCLPACLLPSALFAAWLNLAFARSPPVCVRLPVGAPHSHTFTFISTSLLCCCVCVLSPPAASCSLPIVDAWSEYQSRAPHSWGALLSDGLHLSPSGQELMFTLIMDKVAAAYPTLLPDALPLHFPHHSEIDPATPAASFVDAK